jgi:hypothetical protein
MATNVDAQICVRRDTAANWASSNPTLLNGEVGYDTTNNKIKIGNGTLGWNALAYLTDATGGAGWPDPDNKSVWMTDFIETNVPVFTQSQGSGQAVPYTYGGAGNGITLPDPGSELHPGTLIIAATSGPGAQMRVGWIDISGWDESNWRITLGTTADYEFKAIVSPYLFLSTTGRSYMLHIGYTAAFDKGDDLQSSYQGVFFRYTHSVNSGKWQCAYNLRNTSTGGDEQFWVDSGVTATLDWVNLKAEIINSGPGIRPVLRWTINGNVVATVDMNTLAANYELTGTVVPAASIVSTSTVSPFVACVVDYMHSVTTFQRGYPLVQNNVES